MNSSLQILLKARPETGTDWRGALGKLASTHRFSIESCHASLTDSEIYCYLSTAGDPADSAREIEASARRALSDPTLSASALLPLIRFDGPAHGAVAPFHYVVETNVDAGNEAGLNDWYNVEHLPGLAAVPGCVCAARFRNLSHEPRYIACYDLASPETVERPEWLAVRNTEWSSRVRPNFRGTKRTMFRRLPQN